MVSGSPSSKRFETSSLLVQLLAGALVSVVTPAKKSRKARKKQRKTNARRSKVLRDRVTIEQSYQRLGPLGFRRLYRMHYESFCKLHLLLDDGIERVLERRRSLNLPTSSDPRNRANMVEPPIPNGPIPTSLRLGIAIRFFKGCPSYDIHEIFGVSHAAVIDSIWTVVQAINQHPAFRLEYPADHQAQLDIADEFRSVSAVDFDNCAGAIDGILIWIHKPSIAQAIESEVGQAKYYCGRKSKFGLNCQAVADVRGRILDLSINYGGASSDLLAFEASSLYHRLERGLLAPGLNLYGDNAYLNSSFMATPFPNISKGPKDDYNFFQSQVRIRVECAFGIFVNRWAILRSIIPAGISIKRTIALIVALAKLHNFCIDETDECMEYDCATEEDSDVAATSRRRRRQRAVLPLVAAHRQDHGVNDTVPIGLLDGGDHLLDHPRGTRSSDNNLTRCTRRNALLPRELMLQQVIASGKTRPTLQRDGAVVFV